MHTIIITITIIAIHQQTGKMNRFQFFPLFNLKITLFTANKKLNIDEWELSIHDAFYELNNVFAQYQSYPYEIEVICETLFIRTTYI